MKKLSTLLLLKVIMKYKKMQELIQKYTDVIKVLTALNGSVKSCWRLFLLLSSHSC